MIKSLSSSSMRGVVVPKQQKYANLRKISIFTKDRGLDSGGSENEIVARACECALEVRCPSK